MDKQKQGIGAYKDRPGYFLGGMVGGAILGALVNKIQGKDMKRGAIFGGLTGGLGNAFLKPGSIGTSWMKGMDDGIMKSILGAATKSKGAAALAGIGLGGTAAYMADDPAFLRKKQEEEMARLEEEQRRKNNEIYAD